MNWFKRFFCKHSDQVWMRNIYGDEVRMLNWKRSVWGCGHCGRVILKDELHEYHVILPKEGPFAARGSVSKTEEGSDES